jgi:hypothetical protein
MSRVLRYHRPALWADYARAGAGILLCALPLLLLHLHWLVALIFALLLLLFCGFAWRVWRRHRVRLWLDTEKITASGWRDATILWRDLGELRLSYFSTRRDRQRGWMQLMVRAGRTRLTFESTLEGFQALVEEAAAAAATRDLKLSSTTVDNLAALGIFIEDPARGRKNRWQKRDGEWDGRPAEH